LFNICVNTWEKTGKKPSVRYNSFRLIVKIAKKHPELFNEIILLTQNQYMESLSGTARRSILRMINRLKPEIID
jgi:hypothetical protein